MGRGRGLWRRLTRRGQGWRGLRGRVWAMEGLTKRGQDYGVGYGGIDKEESGIGEGGYGGG